MMLNNSCRPRSPFAALIIMSQANKSHQRQDWPALSFSFIRLGFDLTLNNIEKKTRHIIHRQSRLHVQRAWGWGRQLRRTFPLLRMGKSLRVNELVSWSKLRTFFIRIARTMMHRKKFHFPDNFSVTRSGAGGNPLRRWRKFLLRHIFSNRVGNCIMCAY